MDPSLIQPEPAAPIEEDEWDTDGFVIPDLSIRDSDLETSADASSQSKCSPKTNKEEKIYLGPHGAPPSTAKQQDSNPLGNKKKFKSKLKEADRKFSGHGRENKVETLRELVGTKPGNATMQKGSPREWLDPHCHESQFERYSR